MSETIEIEYGLDTEGKAQKLVLPKTLRDESGAEYDAQDIINKINGKVKSTTQASLEKRYGSRIKELETMIERTSGMISMEDARKIQDELEELKISRLPEKEQEIQRLILERDKLKNQAERFNQDSQNNLSRYQDYRRSNEILRELPTHGVIEEAMEDQMEIIKKYGKFTDKDELYFDNIFEENGEPMTVKTFLSKWYATDKNKYALKSSLVGGAGTERAQRNTAGKTIYSGKTFQGLLAAANPQERAKLNRQRNSGEIVIQD